MSRRDTIFPLDSGGNLHLFDLFGPGVDPNGVDPQQNIHRYDKEGNLVWVIHRGKPIQGDWSCYVGIETMSDGTLNVHAFDGCVYRLNVDTGEVTFLEWEK